MIQRYDYTTDYGSAKMVKDESGDYVRYEDHLASMSEWQPIASVPINTRVLVYAPSSKYVKVFEATAYPDGQFFDPVYTEWDGGGATHWMPLPSPPKPVDKQGTGS